MPKARWRLLSPVGGVFIVLVGLAGCAGEEASPGGVPTSTPMATAGTSGSEPLAPSPVTAPPPLDLAEDAGLIERYAKSNGLTFDEAVERLEWQRLVPVLDADIRRNLDADTYGGVWLDADSGRVQVGVVRQRTTEGTDQAVRADAETVVMDASQRVGLAEAVDVVPVDYAFSELVAGSNWLGEQVLDVVTVQSGMDPSINRVVLDLPAGLKEADLGKEEAAVLEQARSELGDMLVVHFDAVEVALG